MQCKDIPDRRVIELADNWQRADAGEPVYDALVSEFGQPKVCWTKIERLVARGLLDYGTSPRCAWPTPEGMALLAHQ